MNNTLRRGMHDIRTRSSLTGEAENRHRKFLRAASLELKKSLCSKVRVAARKRLEDMDKKIADLDEEKTQLLASTQVSEQNPMNPTPVERPASESGSQERRGFALRY